MPEDPTPSEPVDPYMLRPATPARPTDLFPNPPAELPILRRNP